MCVVHSFVELVFTKVMCGAFLKHGNVLSLSAAWVMPIYAYIYKYIYSNGNMWQQASETFIRDKKTLMQIVVLHCR